MVRYASHCTAIAPLKLQILLQEKQKALKDL